MRTEASFRTDYPVDGIWDENDYLIKTSGETLTKAIAAGLAKRGCVVLKIKEDYEHCWFTDVELDDVRFRVYVWDLGDECLCKFDPARKPSRAAVKLVGFLHETLVEDDQVSDLGWHATGSDFKEPRTATPFDEPPPRPVLKPVFGRPPKPDFGPGLRGWLRGLWWHIRWL